MGHWLWPMTHVTHPKMVTHLTHDPWPTDPFPSLRRTFPVSRRLIANRYPKKRVFRQIRSLNGNFSGVWNRASRATTWTRVLVSLAEIDPRKVAEVVRGSRHKKTTPLRVFHPNPSRFPRFISENDVSDRYTNRRSDPTDRIADNYTTVLWGVVSTP